MTSLLARDLGASRCKAVMLDRDGPDLAPHLATCAFSVHSLALVPVGANDQRTRRSAARDPPVTHGTFNSDHGKSATIDRRAFSEKSNSRPPKISLGDIPSDT